MLSNPENLPVLQHDDEEPNPRRVAVFDFDGTITVKDTFIEFALHALGPWRFALGLVKASPWLAGWKLGLRTGAEAKEKLFGYLYAGMKLAEFERRGASFAPKISKMLHPLGSNRLKVHVDDGDTVYIISASMPAWIRPWAAERGVPPSHVMGTEPEVDADGRLTGRFATPNCSGEQKVRRLEQCEPCRADYELWAYGNSEGDEALFAYAENATRL